MSESSNKSSEVFKVPTLVNNSLITKLTKPPLDGAKQKIKPPLDGAKETTQPLDDATEQDNLSQAEIKKNTRPLVSFRTKSNKLPASVYKPHQPSSTEYLIREAQQQGETPVKKPAHDKKVPNKVEGGKNETKSPTPKLDYSAPRWSTPIDSSSYSLEVLKAGAIVNNHELKEKDHFVFGRLPVCDFMLEHPSISRHHAVLQFGKPNEADDVELQKDGSAGFYLIDLGSTHGTFINKTKIPSNKYYRVKVGHMMKFGGSTRIHILQGPSSDEEAVADQSPSELREINRAKREDLAKRMLGDDVDNEENECTKRSVDKDAGISWGMLEDAVEEEQDQPEGSVELGLTDIKERFYVKDPHKALKNFYEKEGIELDFECTEKRAGQWTARLEMPVDTPSGHAIYAEASVTGKRRDAVNNCALEACRILDKHGMFKQSERHHRKVKQWEKDDFYDSDEDGYLDRTGELDVKRTQRQHRIGRGASKSGEKVQTYQSLNEQIDLLGKEISQIEKQLDEDKKVTQSKPDMEDPLEAFMQEVRAGRTLDSSTRSKLKQRLFAARKESARLGKLAAIARPSSLPPLNNSINNCMSFIGRMKGKRKPVLNPPRGRRMEENNQEEEEEENQEEEPMESLEIKIGTDQQAEEQPSRLEPNISSIPIDSTTVPRDCTESPKNPTLTTSNPSVTSSKTTPNPTNPTKPPIIPTQLPTEPRIIPTQPPIQPLINPIKTPTTAIQHPSTLSAPTHESLPDEQGSTVECLKRNSEDQGIVEEQKEQPKSKKRKRIRKHVGQQKEMKVESSTNDPNFADWLPPQDQTGDGNTSLNAKYGY